MNDSKPETRNQELAAKLAQLDRQNLLRVRRTLQSPQGAHVAVDGRNCLAFCSNDYLGLAGHPALVQAARAGAERCGVGAGASHLVCGHHAAHHELEQALARFTGLPRALLFSSGYLANLGVVTALMGRGDAVFADKLNHASLNDAARLSRSEFRRYPHLDLAALEKMLARSHAGRKLVATDAVFSMDGDIAPVAQLLELCERHDAWLLLDDAHGFGVLGESGGGVLAHCMVRSPRVIYMATLGKAAGVCGAFVAAQEEVVETLIQKARTYIYTTALPPLLAHAVLAGLEAIKSEPWRRTHLRHLIAMLQDGLRLNRWRLAPSQTAIQPLLVGANEEALAASAALFARGIWVAAIRPPTVPQGTARLRISLSAAHREEDVERLIAALQDAEKETCRRG